MLKNIELFDKLALRFNNRILFLKDIIGEDICVWTFFGYVLYFLAVPFETIFFIDMVEKSLRFAVRRLSTRPRKSRQKLSFQKPEFMKKR